MKTFFIFLLLPLFCFGFSNIQDIIENLQKSHAAWSPLIIETDGVYRISNIPPLELCESSLPKIYEEYKKLGLISSLNDLWIKEDSLFVRMDYRDKEGLLLSSWPKIAMNASSEIWESGLPKCVCATGMSLLIRKHDYLYKKKYVE